MERRLKSHQTDEVLRCSATHFVVYSPKKVATTLCLALLTLRTKVSCAFCIKSVFGCVFGSKWRETAGTCPFSSQQRLDDTETTCFSFVLVLGMQGSGDPAEAQDRRLTTEPTAGSSASRVVRVCRNPFFGDCVLSQTEKTKLKERV